jgi:hypothetical protein
MNGDTAYKLVVIQAPKLELNKVFASKNKNGMEIIKKNMDNKR